MKGTITNYRSGRHTQHTNQFIVKIDGIDTKEKAQGFIGVAVTWTSSAGKNIKGKITHTHGNSGALRARFEKGLPGQAIGGPVDVAK